MGWASRAREARERMELTTFTVKQWTAFEWEYPEGKGKAATKQRAELRDDRTDNLKRAADMIGRKLRSNCPSMKPSCKQVKVKREPQLLFEFTVEAVDEHDARRRVTYRISRALSVKVATGGQVPVRMKDGTPTGIMRPERKQLRPPMGEIEVAKKLPSPRKRKAAAA